MEQTSGLGRGACMHEDFPG